MEANEIQDFRKQIRVLERELILSLRKETEKYSITVSQAHIISELGKHDEVSLLEVSSVLGLDTTTVLDAVNIMVEKGLAESSTRYKDRRYVYFKLSEKGTVIYNAIEEIYNNHYMSIFNLIPPDKHNEVIEGITLFSDALQEFKYRSNTFIECCE